ncbi:MULTISPECIES: DUF882 domain-containing protein [Thalassolituus]|jgi:uncharacterized protein YcbK (DUF882 family)|uniref:DUF882 domain-containing protein n=1 Tax=Thalassolituus TaxID=187492 RepID=UPI000C51040C|nr:MULTISPECIES: DUF882 domain-containing protein [Thalassolituus]MAY15418.1 hypothetical protein [Oceanospirillaceae bacterium]PIQ41092.1 MAG: hypothetical protein COW58_02815 [Thalassolituus sp. CG17_big_fil_post_rev_8_21_14_2_50_53_8]MCA6059189.1 DUF882 domain-containing protein [Thalassolituus sp. ST750PaO-4]MCB2386512.1 DUF882 domain-containing protein [Thalassolituus alkanivorans]MCB2422995.1 DUF882 domain-containing protein [Thalassolituus alkanivorans]|tara:strand:+ start:785 stop:1330 length:546 start_codon:yes stop_codon:yes gene_type:complete
MLQRRHFLKQAACLGAAGITGLSSTRAFAGQQEERTLRLYNIHTGEFTTSTFWANGRYIDEGVESLDILVRDHRRDQVMAMQRELYQNMYQLQQLFASHEPLYVISGYRAPESNASLRYTSSGVAEHSLHMQGRAIDIRIPGVSHRHLHRAALAMGNGGVGYYPKSGFVHIDTGRTRHWTA